MKLRKDVLPQILIALSAFGLATALRKIATGTLEGNDYTQRLAMLALHFASIIGFYTALNSLYSLIWTKK